MRGNNMQAGKTYRRDAAELRDVIPGDNVVVTLDNPDYGRYEVSGVVRKAVASGMLCVGPVIIIREGAVISSVESIHVISLASRGQEWAGARVVLDGGLPLLNSGPWFVNTLGGQFPVDELALREAPPTVLLDADKRIPIDSVLKVNGVCRSELERDLRRNYDFGIEEAEQAVNTLLTTLGGKS